MQCDGIEGRFAGMLPPVPQSRDGFLVHTPVGWTDAFRRADELSETHAATEGQRTIDLLHVAIALECGTKTFLSFDQRQRTLAKIAGLKVKP